MLHFLNNILWILFGVMGMSIQPHIVDVKPTTHGNAF